MRIKRRPVRAIPKCAELMRKRGPVLMRRFPRKYGTSSDGMHWMSRIGTTRSILERIEQFTAPARRPMLATPLLQLRRRGAIEHVAFVDIEYIERVGLDRQRSALALDLGDFLDDRELVRQGRRIAGPDLVDVQHFSGELRRRGFGHVDPADALVLLRDASAVRQIEG